MSTIDDTARAARDAAILSLLPRAEALAARAAHKIGASIERFEEIRASGFAGAIEAVDAFDPTRGVALEAFAQLVIRRAVQREARKNLIPVINDSDRGSRPVSLLRVVSLDELQQIVGFDAEIIASPDPGPGEIVANQDIGEEVRQAVVALPPRERAAVEERFFGAGGAVTLSGISRQRVSQITQRAFERLRKALGPRLNED